MSAVSTVTVVPDYNSNNQAMALANQAISNATIATATSNTAVANSLLAISEIPFSVSSIYTTPYSLGTSFAPITNITFITTLPSQKMIIWAIVNVQDAGSGSSARFFLQCNTPIVQNSLSFGTNLSNGSTEVVPIVFSAVGNATPGLLFVTLYGTVSPGSATFTSSQIIALVNT